MTDGEKGYGKKEGYGVGGAIFLKGNQRKTQ